MNIDGADISDAKRLIIREVRLHDFAVFKGDLISHDMADAVAGPALHLGLDHIRVHRQTAIDGANHTFDLHIAIFIARDLSDLGNIAAIRFVNRDALAAALGGAAPRRIDLAIE